FGYRRWGCEMGIRFPLVKLLDYRGQDLEGQRNPFAVAVLAHLKALETAGDAEGRYRGKLHLVRGLYQRGYGRKDILELFRFIDWVLQLPAALEDRFWSELQTYEEAQKMTYVTSVERIGIRKGIEQGIQQGIQQGEALTLKRQLVRRFGPLPPWAEERIDQAERADLERWLDRVLDAGRLEEVFELPGP
ncbi:MAG: DUF4351 domain-containing protein, partial [Pseudomonadota bacterium]|nr:DUF4351 domain-containing protein [Pseudomonadota bacterium]